MKRLFLLLFLIPIAGFSKNQQLQYQPVLVNVKGYVKTLKFPGPPNYISIKDGDADETGGYLILNMPIDVISSRNSNNVPEKNVKLIQLIVHNANDWKKLQDYNQVQIEGTLLHALTGHHHARVLIKIKKVTILSTATKPIQLDLTQEDQKFLQHEYLQE